ncbi:hypothetical protein RDI58_001114 [Solanum bulbocastanum]|uniref:Uncharacterized protein n=1 Tax=Solanum bulbocastanum TaxID=147425 RepID=A0AAN8UBB4_SOLBU
MSLIQNLLDDYIKSRHGNQGVIGSPYLPKLKAGLIIFLDATSEDFCINKSRRNTRSVTQLKRLDSYFWLEESHGSAKSQAPLLMKMIVVTNRVHVVKLLYNCSP